MQKDPKDKKFTGSLSKVLGWLWSYKDRASVDFEDADLFSKIDCDESICHVQFESFEGEKYERPIVWRIKEWKTCYTKHLLDKASSEQRRKEANLLSENTSLLMRSLSKHYGIENPEILRGIAMKLSRTKKQELIEKLGIKTRIDLGE